MASTNFSYSGSTGVLEASASISEVTTTGTSRTLRLRVFVQPIDYSGARTFGWNASCGDQSSSGNGSSIDGSGKTIFDKNITVNVPYGSTTASIDFSFSCTVVSPSAGNKSISGTITRVSGLTLQQGSTSISSATNTSFGSACSVTWTPSSSSNYNKLKFTLGTWSYTTGLFCPNRTTAYTYNSYTIPYEAAAQIPNADTATMTVTLYTYSNSSGTSQIGSASSMDFTVTLPVSVVPSITSSSATIDNSENAAVAQWGIAVAGFTKLRVTAAASGSYGSTISRFIISGVYEEVVNASSLDYTGRVIQSSGDKTVSIVAIDSRGRRSASVTTTAVSFASYTSPTISQLTAERRLVTTSGVEHGYASLKAIFAFDIVGGKNTASAKLYYRRSGTTGAWIEYGTQMTNNVTLNTNIELSDEASFNFKLVLTDSVGSSIEKVAFLSTAKVLLDFKKDGDGLGIGKICEAPGLEVSMDATFFGEVNIGEISLSTFIQNIMRYLPSDMFGDGEPSAAGAKEGQWYFRKLS